MKKGDRVVRTDAWKRKVREDLIIPGTILEREGTLRAELLRGRVLVLWDGDDRPQIMNREHLEALDG